MLQNKISHGKFEAGKSFRKAIVQAQFRKDFGDYCSADTEDYLKNLTSYPFWEAFPNIFLTPIKICLCSCGVAAFLRVFLMSSL